MVDIHKLIGRLSNQMFIVAHHYAWCRDFENHFFVQDEKYFKKYEAEIRNLFGANIVPGSIDRVAVHVRLTDYVGNSFYVDLGHHEHEKIEENYYSRAIAMFPGEKFTVFSDDIETAKKWPMFQGDRFEFSEGRSAVDDMNYMACHKSHIIANSSFSWWGAWLGKHPNQKVVAPKQWFSDKNNDVFIGLLDSWIKI